MTTKRIIQTLLLLTGFLTVCTTYAQEYNYIHYDVKDGLAGSTVYDVCQDKDGFIWFATESGLSRFDGAHFKNFTTTDGLPETEILKLFADSKGRIWMAPFKNTICYYYNGKIHNQENDSLLKRFIPIHIVSEFFESIDHAISFKSDNNSAVILNGDKIFKVSRNNNPYCFLVRPNPIGKGFQLTINDSCFIITNGKMVNVPCSIVGRSLILNSKLQKQRSALRPYAENFTPCYDNLLFSNTSHGSWMVDTTTFDHYEEVFLKEKQVSRSMVDKEKNIWFTTLGEGVYKLASREFKSQFFCKNQTQEIFSLTKANGKVYAGTAFGKIYSMNGSKVDTLNITKEFEQSVNYNSTNRINSLRQIKDGSLLIGADGLLLKITNKGKIFNPRIYAIKSVDELENGMLLVGTGRRTLLVNPTDMSVQDTIWENRTTSACFYDNAYYIGTVNGLYLLTTGEQQTYLGDAIPSLRQRISYFYKTDAGLWVATYGAGVFCLKNGRVLKHITTQEGLSSNICRTLFVNKNFLWVGTDKGLNKVNLSQTPYPVTTYSATDGLPTDIINAVYVDSNTIYVGSPAGVTWFNETKVANYSRCNLRILDISVENRSQPLQNSYELSYRENSLKISYAGVSFKSGGNIWYRYRLRGLTDNWDSTTQNVLEYPSLPPGNYQFEMIAINKKGIVSNAVNISFIVDAPFWQTLPFQVSVIAIAILITWLLVAWRFSVLRKKEQEKTSIQQTFNELEQMALRSQMNPHFIFNCLNSIQNFIITNNLEASNWYLTEFAHLIRQTLDNSEKGVISITKEVKYLKRYLELEMMRFGHSFNYTIEVDPELDAEMVQIPTMILQPYIENSIRHGIRYLENGGGRIDIRFQKGSDMFLCIIQDNGIGRKKASEYRSQMHMEYQSKGMSLTAERINILNRQLSQPITIEIIDLTNEQGQGNGTKVVLRFPYNITFKPVKK